jgi:undecaprenyl diphosphate synthase
MQLFRFVFHDSREKLMRVKEYGVSIRFAGNISRFSKDIQEDLRSIEKETEDGAKGSITFALSYGGRADIVQAVNRVIEEGKTVVTEEDIESHLWTLGTPDPDLIIRTGGEQRLSNFLTWQSVYSELVFTPLFWPDFSPQTLEDIFTEYAHRERRFGT